MLFTDETGEREQYVQTVQTGLELGLNGGDFNNAQADVVQLTYVEVDENGNPVNLSPTLVPGREVTVAPTISMVVEPDGSEDDSPDFLLPLLLVGGAVFIVGAGIITYRNTSA